MHTLVGAGKADGAMDASNLLKSGLARGEKVIDLIDEAASRLRMQVDSKPEELDELDRRIIQLKIEHEAPSSENARPCQ
jgi:ATP-dependent Clp protease ATP-binding subunit ClpA